MATVLYTALTPLTVSSFIATWYADAGDCLPLNPAKQSTINLLAAGSIELAGPDAVDTTTPANTLRGLPGVRVGISN